MIVVRKKKRIFSFKKKGRETAENFRQNEDWIKHQSIGFNNTKVMGMKDKDFVGLILTEARFWQG